MKAKMWLIMAMVAGSMLAGGCCTSCKRPVTSVPPAAQKAIDQYAEGGTVREMEMKKKCGRDLYEAEVKKTDGTKLEILVSEDGTLYKFSRQERRRQ